MHKKKTNHYESKAYWLYGKHPVVSALLNPERQCYELLLVNQCIPFLRSSGINIETLNIPHQIVQSNVLDKILPEGAVHQGLALKTQPLETISLHEFLMNRSRATSTLVLLDQITDPHNVGAIIRTAAAFNIDAVIVTARHGPKESAILAKSSAGMIEKMPIITVTNLADTISILKEHNYWLIGMDGNGSSDVTQAAGFDKLGIIFGSEGKGLRRLTAANCDLLCRIDISSAVESLNVSNAAAIMMYEVSKRNIKQMSL